MSKTLLPAAIADDPRVVFSQDKTDDGIAKGEAAFAALVEAIRKENPAGEIDISTDKARKDIISRASKVTKSKTAIDEARKAVTKEARQFIDDVNARGKAMVETLAEMAAEIRKPVTEWERAREALAARVALVDLEIDRISVVETDHSSEDIAVDIQALRDLEISVDLHGDDADRLCDRRDQAIKKLEYELKRLHDLEVERAELDRLRKAEAERAQLAEVVRVADQAMDAATQACAQTDDIGRMQEHRSVVLGLSFDGAGDDRGRLDEKRETTLAVIDAQITSAERVAEDREREAQERQARIDEEARREREIQEEKTRAEREKHTRAIDDFFDQLLLLLQSQDIDKILDGHAEVIGTEIDDDRCGSPSADRLRGRRDKIASQLVARLEGIRHRQKIEADKEHRAVVMKAVVDALIGRAGLGLSDADRVVAAIEAGEIDHVEIKF